MAKKPRVLIIGTGGAISAKPTGKKWSYGEIPGEELLKLIPGIKEKFEIKTTNLLRIDSSDLSPKEWLTLTNLIYYNLKDFDGIVVTIGTDTLTYAATAVSFMIQNSNIPIVFTGSQLDPTQLNTDATGNLKNAIIVAGQADIAETIIVFNNKIMRATRTIKINSSEFDAFESANKENLGTINYQIQLEGNYRKRSNSKPVLQNSLETNVAIIKVYPGFNTKRITALTDNRVKGIVMEGFGLGNFPVLNTPIKEALAYASKKNVPVIVTSSAYFGKYWKKTYPLEMGARLKGLKIIPVYDMLTETAYVKLMWALAQTQNIKEIKKIMQKNIAGEISAI